MNDKKNIDKLFQDRFSDFQVSPPEAVWEHIEAALKEKKKRRVVPFWFKLSGAAAVFLLGLLLMNQFLSDDKIGNEVVSEVDSIPKTESKAADKIVIDNNVVRQSETRNSKNDSNSPSLIQDKIEINANQITVSDIILNNKTNQKIGSKSVVVNQIKRQKQINQNTKSEYNLPIHRDANTETNGIADNTNQTAIQGSENTVGQTEKEQIITKLSSQEIKNILKIDDIKTDTTAVATVVPNALEELLHEKEKEVPTSQEPKLNRWQITSTVAPVYFSSTSNGSPLDSRFENNNKNYKPTVSYGIGAAYAVNKKLSIRAGVSAVALEYNTNDIAISQSASARKLENVSNNVRGNLIQIDNLPEITKSNFQKPGTTQYAGSLNQKTGYIEVPVELSYKLVNQKFGVALIGGLSTLFLNQNEIAIVSSGLDMTIGEASNLNPVHFSTNLGVGLNYNFLRSFQLNFEPMFKYQINSYSSDSGNFKPYYLGLYTGISYKF